MQASGQNSGNDQANNFLILVCFVIFMVGLLWFLDKSIIVRAIFLFRLIEIKALLFVLPVINKAAYFLHLSQIDFSSLNDSENFILGSVPSEVVFFHLMHLGGVVGSFLRYISIFIISFMVVFLLVLRKGNKFSSVYSMDKLRAKEKKNWPQITPIHSLNLVKEDINKGPWAMAASPLNFCKKHKLIRRPTEEGVTSWELIKLPAYRLFSLQLGSLWRGPRSLPVYMQALFVIFSLCTDDKRDKVDQLIRQIAESSRSGKLNFSGVSELIGQYENTRLTQWMASRHAYVSTLLASLLEAAREGGVLATAEFIWLKPLNRKLWYLLNSVGRQTAVIEAAGPFSHWLAEKRVKRALKVPMIKTAVDALEESIADSLYVDRGDSWHTPNED